MEKTVTGAWLRAQQRGAHRPPTIIDVREPTAYAVGHIRAARNLPFDELADRTGEIPGDRPAVVYCDMQRPGHSRSERAAAMLRARGVAAFALEGGYPAWKSVGHPIEGSGTGGPADA